MMDISPLYHAAMAVILQCFAGFLFGMWGLGGVLGCLWFLAREQTQAEYRWIALFGKGRRANMPWWGGFDIRVWDVASLLDWFIPLVACAAVFLIAHVVQ